MKKLTGENLLEARSASTFYVPDQGDLIWTNFNPQVGREQSGSRPAIVISTLAHNILPFGLAVVCPITTKIKGYPFEVTVSCQKISGVILANQIKSLDWRHYSRSVKFEEKASPDIVEEVISKLLVIIPLPSSMCK